jgi:hypothetical protein
MSGRGLRVTLVRRLGRAAVVGAALLASPLLAADDQPSAAQLMDDLMWARGPIGGPFALIDHTGKVRTDVDFRGKLSAYLFEVKKPEESKYPGDFFKTRATIPAAEAFRPLKDGGCPLVSG